MDIHNYFVTVYTLCIHQLDFTNIAHFLFSYFSVYNLHTSIQKIY